MANRTDPVTPLAAHRQAIARHCRADEAAAVAALVEAFQPFRPARQRWPRGPASWCVPCGPGAGAPAAWTR